MSHEDDLDALLRATLREEAEPTGYVGGLDQPVFRGVRRRRQRRVATGAIGGALAIALAVGGVSLLNGGGETHVQPAGGGTSPTVTVVPTLPRVTQTVTQTVVAPDPNSPDAPSGTGSSSSGSTGSGMTTWDSLPVGDAAQAFVGHATDGSHTTLVWDGKTVVVPLTSSGAPGLRTVSGPQGTEYVVLKAHDPKAPAPASGDDVYLVARDGSTRLAFKSVVGAVVESRTGTPRIAAYSAASGELEIRDVDGLKVQAHTAATENTRPLTWGDAGILLRNGDVVDDQGKPLQNVSGVTMAATSGKGVTYAVAGERVIKVTRTGTTDLGATRPGQGSAVPAAAPNDDYLATVGGVMDLRTGRYVIGATGEVSSIQWVDETHVVFMLTGENVRCNVATRTCEAAPRGGMSTASLLAW